MDYKIDVYLRDLNTGYSDVYHTHDPFDNEFYNNGFGTYLWSEGNYSCDCNRSLFLYCYAENGTGKYKDYPCGEGNIIIDKIVRVDTGEILYSENEEDFGEPVTYNIPEDEE